MCLSHTKAHSMTVHLHALVQHDIHCAPTAMDRTMGTILNYHQLLHHPEYNAEWTKSSGNEFCCPENDVSGHVKSTNTIHAICKKHIPKECCKDVTYYQSQEPNLFHLLVGGDRINWQLPCPQQICLSPRFCLTASSPLLVLVS